MTSDAPEGWTVAKLGDICSKPQYGWTSRAAKTGKVKYVRTSDISDGAIDWAAVPYCEDPPPDIEKYRVRPNDILVSRAGSVGISCRVVDVPCDAVFASYLIRFRANNGIPPEYVEYFLQSHTYWRSIADVSAGIAVPNVNASKLSSIEISLAPRDEQSRIVAKLKDLFARVDQCDRRLAGIPNLLKRFRQSVLAAGSSGRLTASGRDERTNRDPVPGDWWSQPLEDLLPGRGGIFDGPFGSHLKSSDYASDGVRVIRLENVGQLRFIGEKETFISARKYESLTKHSVREGDIIFASFVADEVRACLLPHLSTAAIAKADCFCIRPRADLVDREYLLYQLISQHSHDALLAEVHGATRPRINTKQLRQLQIRMCPITEQREIVRRVRELFALADKAEARYGEAVARLSVLRGALLAKAFSGQLVLTDAGIAGLENFQARYE